MTAFEALSSRGQLARLRQLACRALEDYGLAAERMKPLKHEHNTTFQVTASDQRCYMLRLHRPGQHSLQAIQSELLWLSALQRDTDLAVPVPVPTKNGSLLTSSAVAGVPEARVCVLFHWLPGRFQDKHLKPRHLQRVGRFTACLHEHTTHWQRPEQFVRGRVDVLTADARRIPFSPAEVGKTHLDRYPSEADVGQSARLVSDLFSTREGRIIEKVSTKVRLGLHELGSGPEAFGVIHGDLHQENYLFHRGQACAIDFDDCGWGHYLFDLTVTLWEVENHPQYGALREAYLAGYRSVRPLPGGHEQYLETFIALRRMQILMWVLESREHPAFRKDWDAWAQYDLNKLEEYLVAS